jgi:flavin reductase (DIM6/NTAB) family NADH-FMN oxidoreductase RutF
MEKIRLENNVFIPMPVTLVGSTVNGKPNFMAVGWVSRVNADPPLVAVAIYKKHHTPSGILENRTFSVCVPGIDLIEKADYCGLVSGRVVDKSGLFTLFYGETKTAPMIRECPLCIECTLSRTIDFPADYLFIGEIAAAYADEHCVAKGKLDIERVKPFFLTMPDNSYWALGEKVGKAWGAGKRLKIQNSQ